MSDTPAKREALNEQLFELPSDQFPQKTPKKGVEKRIYKIQGLTNKLRNKIVNEISRGGYIEEVLLQVWDDLTQEEREGLKTNVILEDRSIVPLGGYIEMLEAGEEA